MMPALYILLGVLVIGLFTLQIWIARSTAPMAGDRSRLVYAIRVMNAVLMVVAVALAAYTLTVR